MSVLGEFIQKGGPVMIAILVLSVVLYSRCCKLLLSLRGSRRLIARAAAAGRTVPAEMGHEVEERFRQQRVALGAMVAAAPLLGLLGTVSGMSRTFESLAGRGGDESMEGLAAGISEVLVATESGLAVAIPALVAIYLAHREVRRLVRDLNRLERAGGEGGS